MNIAQHINQLLYTANYVVIPEFGGFICQEFRAEINPATQMFVPPSRKVSFQPALLDHDNSLLNEIARREGISLEAARTSVQALVSKWLLDLSDGNHVKLEGIGRIYKDHNGDFGFQADVNANYDTGSFGLGIFRFPALQEETKPRTVLRIANGKKGGSFGLWRSAAVVIGVIGLLYLGTQKTDFDNFNVAGLNPMVFSKSNTEVRQVENPSSEALEVESSTTLEVNAEDLNMASDAPETIVEETPISNEEIIIGFEAEMPVHIIVGAFKVEANAEKLQRKLIDQGYQSAGYFYEKGLYRLSINQFESRNDAIASLGSIQDQVQKSAWIYSK